MNIQTMQQTVKTMTSREIAELTGKDHKNVKRDCLVMFNELEIDAPKFERIYFDSMNRQQTEFLLDKDLTITLVAGYNAKVRYLIIQRWQELESQVTAPAFQIPTTLSGALRLAADQADVIEHQRARLAITETKAAALDVIDRAIGDINVRDTAKTLGIPQTKFINWCLKHDWLYRDNAKKLQMHSHRMKQGFMKQRPATFFGSNGEVRVTMQPLFTPKGLTHLAGVFAIVHEVA